MSILKAIASGFIGATALTLIHESTRRIFPEKAPRMDVLGERAIAGLLRASGRQPPDDDTLYKLTLGGDLISNGIYYSFVGAGDPKYAWVRGAVLGLAAGIGGVVLPGPLGLGKAPSGRTVATQSLTIHHYLAGGLVAALAYRLLLNAKCGRLGVAQPR